MFKLATLLFVASNLAAVQAATLRLPTCTDKILNQGEVKVDCGGPCPPCPTCFDGIRNQGEDKIDCGGPCAPCPTCSDKIQNQGETGVDCGGPCSACPPSSRILDANGRPIGISGTCVNPATDSVSGYPCSPFLLKPFGRTFGDTASFNPGTKESLGEVCRQDGHCAAVYEYDVVGIQTEMFNTVLSGQCVGKPTKLLSYGGTVPAKTMNNLSGRETYARFNNKITQEMAPVPEMFNFEGCNLGGKSGVPLTIHNHGQASLAPFDGFAIDETCFGETKNYMFPNNRPTTGWFHDHALHQTAANVLHGMYGLYIIDEKTSKGGCGDPYGLDKMEEIHLILNDAVIDKDCQIYFNTSGPHEIMYFGDINLVNGHPYPVLGQMQRKWYRFRVLDASISRPFLLKLLTPDGTDVSKSLCHVIATDGGYFEFNSVPFPATGLIIGVAERYEFVCDFSSLNSTVSELVLYNDFDDIRMKAVPYFTYSHFLAKFSFAPGPAPSNSSKFDPTLRGNIGKTVPLTILNDAIPEALQMISNGQAHRTFQFGRGNGHWVINGETWDTDRVAAKNVGESTWELWQIIAGGGWFHPVHIHLIDFFILERKTGDGVRAPDTFGQAAAPKDVMYLGPGETIWVIARFGPHKGEYMFHCHNLVHEDNDMLRTFVTITNTDTEPNGPNTGNRDATFRVINGIVYDNYQFADPNVGALHALPTEGHPATLDKATEYLQHNFYRIFYPLPDDNVSVLNNPWLAFTPAQCAG